MEISTDSLVQIALAVGGVASGLMLFWVKSYFTEKSERATKFEDAVAKVEVQMSAMNVRLEFIQTSLARAEGRSDEHANLISSHISTLGHISRQIDALFKFVDAQKRPTDIKSL